MKIVTLFVEYLTNWGLVWFGVIFWGSIFNAISAHFFQSSNQFVFTLVAYLLGLILGLLAKYRGWVWIN
jgi:hypothetical protein